MSQHALAVKFQPGRVDRDAGVIRGVAVITEGVANGLIVDALTLKQIKECSESYANGLKVVDRHTKGTDSVFATVGALKNFTIDGPILRADLFTLKSEANTPKLMEMAESIPDTFGLSVAFSGPNEERGGIAYARCTEIYNAALVDVPAANPSGLFSDDKATDAAVVMVAAVDARTKGKSVTMADNTSPDFEARLSKLETAIAEMSNKMSCLPDDTETDMAETKKIVTALSEEVKGLKELSAKISDRTEFAKNIAQEFAKHTGVTPPVGSSPAGGGGGEKQPTPAEKFVELAKKKFGETKSKTTALKQAMSEDPVGYRAFRDAGADIKWA